MAGIPGDLYAAHDCPRCGSPVELDVRTVDEDRVGEIERCTDWRCTYQLSQISPAIAWRERVRRVLAMQQAGEPLPERPEVTS